MMIRPPWLGPRSTQSHNWPAALPEVALSAFFFLSSIPTALSLHRHHSEAPSDSSTQLQII